MTRGRKLVLAAGLGCLLLIVVLMAGRPAPTGSTGGSAGTRLGVVNVAGHPAAARFALAPLTGRGSRISLSQYGGRPILINFFSSDCAVCRSETPLQTFFLNGGHRIIQRVIGALTEADLNGGLARIQ